MYVSNTFYPTLHGILMLTVIHFDIILFLYYIRCGGINRLINNRPDG